MLVIKPLDYLNMRIYKKIFTNHKLNMYVKTRFSIYTTKPIVGGMILNPYLRLQSIFLVLQLNHIEEHVA